MRRICAMLGALSMAGFAMASVQETWALTGQAHGPGTTPATGNPNSHVFVGGYNLGRVDFSGTLLEVNGTTNDFASENRVRVTLPNGSFTNVQYTSTGGYGPGSLAISGSFYLTGGYGSNAAPGNWGFSFYNTFDDSPTGLGDSSADLTFNLTDELTAPVAPAIAGDFGSITDTQPVYANPDHLKNHIGGAVQWYKLVLDEHALETGKFLDIDTEGSALTDTELGLYNEFGALLSSDDDDGSGNLSELTFGLKTPTRTIGTAVGGNGRDGELSKGTYYLAVAGYNAAFANGFAVTTTSTNTTSNVNVNIRTSIVPEPAALTLLGLGAMALIRRRR